MNTFITSSTPSTVRFTVASTAVSVGSARCMASASTMATAPRPPATVARRFRRLLRRHFLALGATLIGALACLPMPALAQAGVPNPAGIDWVSIGGFDIARTETTVGQFRRHAAATGMVTRAERSGGGQVYEAGWATKPGWNWQTPFGPAGRAADDEPAVHLDFDEATAFCRWAGGRLPTDAEWTTAAYLERRTNPPAPFATGQRYPYPTGERPTGAQCLGDCGSDARQRAIAHGATLLRGHGHARAGVTPAGVNGLHDMGGNAWEWVDEPRGAGPGTERRTRGGSWWYGAAPMREDHLQSKPPQTTVVYIGFRCARDARP